ncbi:MAG: hypothetical protein IT506_07920 [Aquabacterium sp.]|nr:hypothetical protein [Aquabacterium sp.]
MSVSTPIHRRAFQPLLTTLGVACAALLASCGGGGGGGGGSSAPAVVYSVGNAFPLGVSTHSPTALISGTMALSSSSSLVSAVAEGQQGLDNAMVNASGLFDPGLLSHARCYGPTVAFTNHDDQPGTDGTLAAGDVGIWRAVDSTASGAPACSVSELNTQLDAITAQTRQGMLLMAALRRAAAVTGTNRLPDPGVTLDLRSDMSSQLSSLLPGVTVQSATIVAAGDASQYTYRMVLRQGSGTSAESLEVVLLHTPNDTSYRFAGVLRLTHSRLSNAASYGCSDVIDNGTGLYKVAHVTSLGYNRYDDALSTRLRSGQYCGGPSSSGSGSHFQDVVTPTESGELNPMIALSNSGARSGVKGWRRELLRYSADVNLSSLVGDHLHAWQATPVDGKSRIFLVHTDLSGGTRTAQAFHAFGDDFSTSDGTLLGMYCNWSGPGASHASTTAAFQSQSLTLTAGTWAITQSAIQYAPTNSCAATSGMNFDANGDTTLASGEGASTASGLDAPTGGRTDVQSEVIERGYWAPTLF